jgi:hypothetical protein
MKLLAVMVCILMLGSLVSVVGGEEGLFVKITKEKDDYVLGETINITVHVFFDGEYRDPDEINVTVAGNSTYETVENTRTSIGTFMVQHDVTQEDLEDGNVRFRVRVILGHREESESVYFNLDRDEMSDDPGLEVSVQVSTFNPQAGDTIDITVIVTNNSDPVDPDEIELKMEIDSPSIFWNDDEPDETTLELTKTGTGTYTVSHTVSQDDVESHSYQFNAEAQLDEDFADDWIEISSRYYIVWYEQISSHRGGSEIEFRIAVSDLDGSVISSGDIHIQYMALGIGNDDDEGILTGHTNTKGLASFSIPTSFEPYTLVISGWVNGTYNQRIESTIELIDTDSQPDESDFEIILENDQPYYLPDTQLELRFGAYFDGEPVRGKTISVYITSDYQVLFHGNFTPENGSFSVEFTTPSPSTDPRQQYIDIEFILNNSGEYESEWDFIFVGDIGEYIDVDLDIQISTLTTNDGFRVILDDERFIGGGVFALMVPIKEPGREITHENFFQDTDALLEGSPWTPITKGGMLSYYPHDLVEKDGGVFQGDLRVPEYWDDYDSFLIIVMGLTKDFDLFMHFGASAVNLSQNSTQTEKSTDDSFIPGFISFTTMVALFIPIVQKKKKRNE